MCKYCNENLYFKSNWHWSDSGYGDDDYGGVTKNLLLSSLVCPVCGRIKDSAIEQYGSKEEVLKIILHNNFNDMDMNEYNEFVHEVLESDEKELYDLFLKQNSLVITENEIKCTCGKVILEHPNANKCSLYSLTYILEKFGVNYCSTCGRKILPLNKQVNKKDVKQDFIEEDSKETWSRR